MKNSKYSEIIRYVIIGIMTTLISLAIYYSLTLTLLNSKNSIELQIANIISWIGAVTFAYYFNKYYVFKKKEKTGKYEIIKFYLSRILTLLIDMLLMYILVTKLSFNDKIIKPIIQIIIIISNYLISKFYIFRENKKMIR